MISLSCVKIGLCGLICFLILILPVLKSEELTMPTNRSIVEIKLILQTLSMVQNVLAEDHKEMKAKIGQTIQLSRSKQNVVMGIQKMVRNMSSMQTKLESELHGLKLKIDGSVVKSRARDCSDLFLAGERKSGVYSVQPVAWETISSFDVYCDMDTDDGGWTVLQRRGEFSNPEDYFSRTWLEYRTGFGDPNTEFWLGNDQISALTRGRSYELRVDMRDFHNVSRFAKYDTFEVDTGRNNYRLTVSGYSGNSGDSLSYHNNTSFSTKDRDNDAWSQNCALTYHGGWWYNDCHRVNLNGLRIKQTVAKKNQGVVWGAWKNNEDFLSFTEMKIRPKAY